MKKAFGIVLCAVMVAGLAACGPNNPNKRAEVGAVIGAVVGGVAGHQVSRHGQYLGAVLGALAGGAVGHYMDKQQADLQRQLAQEQAAKQLQISKMPGGALRVGIAADATFAIDSATITPAAQTTYAKIASVLKDYDKTVIHVVGNTDNTGTAAYNQQLSERRAMAVANLLMSDGVPAERLRTEGRGESEPIASNNTAAGRRRNRRVDIVIKPIVQGHESDAYSPPPYLGS